MIPSSASDYFIDVFHADDTPLADVISLSSIVKSAIEELLGYRLAKNTVITLLLSPIASMSVLQGSPRLINLQPDIGYITVKVKENGNTVYRHPHTVNELIAKPLQTRLKIAYPDEDLWKFKINLPSISSPIAYPVPFCADTTTIKPYADNEGMAFGIRRVTESPLPAASLHDFKLLTAYKPSQAPLKVLLSHTVYQELIQRQHFSEHVEEGGFLIGRAYQDGDCPEAHIVQISAALPAQHTGASLLHFTYTGDSFMSVKRLLREQYPDERMLGWYHTHLFPAAIPMGLSSTDWDLHFTTFTQPWQIAGLINIDSPKLRTLRFYVKQERLMIPCPYWILPD
jgi:hypothetical protein